MDPNNNEPSRDIKRKRRDYTESGDPYTGLEDERPARRTRLLSPSELGPERDERGQRIPRTRRIARALRRRREVAPRSPLEEGEIDEEMEEADNDVEMAEGDTNVEMEDGEIREDGQGGTAPEGVRASPGEGPSGVPARPSTLPTAGPLFGSTFGPVDRSTPLGRAPGSSFGPRPATSGPAPASTSSSAAGPLFGAFFGPVDRSTHTPQAGPPITPTATAGLPNAETPQYTRRYDIRGAQVRGPAGTSPRLLQEIINHAYGGFDVPRPVAQIDIHAPPEDTQGYELWGYIITGDRAVDHRPAYREMGMLGPEGLGVPFALSPGPGYVIPPGSALRNGPRLHGGDEDREAPRAVDETIARGANALLEAIQAVDDDEGDYDVPTPPARAATALLDAIQAVHTDDEDGGEPLTPRGLEAAHILSTMRATEAARDARWGNLTIGGSPPARLAPANPLPGLPAIPPLILGEDPARPPPNRALTAGERNHVCTRRGLDDTDRNGDGTLSCPICLTEADSDDVIEELPCGHWFHDQCIRYWLTEHNTCPVCRWRWK